MGKSQYSALVYSCGTHAWQPVWWTGALVLKLPQISKPRLSGERHFISAVGLLKGRRSSEQVPARLDRCVLKETMIRNNELQHETFTAGNREGDVGYAFPFPQTLQCDSENSDFKRKINNTAPKAEKVAGTFLLWDLLVRVQLTGSRRETERPSIC